MIKGCQKRVLWVKNIESECFDGAFFIVSDKSTDKPRTETSMVAEANRIISETPITNYFGIEKNKKERLTDGLKSLRIKWFLVGVFITAAISVILQIF